MFTFQVIQGRPLAGAISGIVGGLIAGGALTWVNVLGERKLNRQGISASTMHPVQERQLEVEVTPDIAFAASKSAILAVPKARIVGENSSAGQLDASVGISWRSFGEILSVKITKLGETNTRISVRSKPRIWTTVVDYGKGVENVEIVLRQLQSQICSKAS